MTNELIKTRNGKPVIVIDIIPKGLSINDNQITFNSKQIYFTNLYNLPWLIKDLPISMPMFRHEHLKSTIVSVNKLGFMYIHHGFKNPRFGVTDTEIHIGEDLNNDDYLLVSNKFECADANDDKTKSTFISPYHVIIVPYDEIFNGSIQNGLVTVKQKELETELVIDSIAIPTTSSSNFTINTNFLK